MEDEEDLELLRLAALKTLHKKETVPASAPAQILTNNHIIPVLNSGRPPIYPVADPIQPNLIHHPVPPYVNAGFEKMDINEPYVPQRILPTNIDPFNGFSSTFGASSAIDETNVQLSPRSAAFVHANKEIIKRRQTGMSPSPEPYRKSPGRWSRSPSRESYKYRRSVSRSPPYQNHSPNMRNRRSRSPIARGGEGNFYRTEKRSPNRMRSPPNNRNGSKWRPHSPHRNNGVHPRKSNSPRTDDTNYRNKRRSPVNPKTDVKKRSLSRSPNRKYSRDMQNSRRGGRRSPIGKRFNGNRQNNQRNRIFIVRSSMSLTRRAGSPSNQQKRKSPTNNSDETGESSNKMLKNESKMEKNEENEMKSKLEDESNTNVPKEKSEKELEDELLASSGDESDDDDDDDGIDLFASEESESENEGRFKSSSKTERNTNMPTVSFSELGKTSTASVDVLRDLDEVQTETNSSHRKGKRDDGRHPRRRYNDKRSYSDRNRGTRERENRDSNRVSNRKKDNNAEPSTTRSERKPFKSTFTSVEAEPRRKTPEASKHRNE